MNARSPQTRPGAETPGSARRSQPRSHLTVIPGGRGRPETVLLRTTVALEPALEGVALADDVLATCARVVLAIAAGSRSAATDELNRLGARSWAARQEFRALAGAIETPRPSVA